MIHTLTPQDLGLPAKFSSWRPGQILALERSMSSPHRFLAHSMPTGEGKSAFYIAEAISTADRACILTSTKGLQKQLMDDFSSIGLTDMKGRNNYHCVRTDCRNCEEGQHHRCPPQECEYEIHRDHMIESSLVETNYSYYTRSYTHGRGMGIFDLLILDEAHDAPDEVCAAMAVTFAYWEATKIGTRYPTDDDEIEVWQDWATSILKKIDRRIQELKSQAESNKREEGRISPSTSKELHFWTGVQSKCASVAAIEGEWIIERTGDGYKLEPVWASDYAEKILFRGIPKIILTSATMVTKTIGLLGIPIPEMSFYEYKSSFPSHRSPVYLWGPCRIDHRTGPDFLAVWISRMDNIIRQRLDRKGIIHSISYDRARFIKQNSEFGMFMIMPKNGRETLECIRQFKASQSPSILISPSITTGFDFPGDECRYNIIPKVPFLDTRGKVISARQEKDPEYAPYITAQTIVQAHGRSMRGLDDFSETFILDDHITWFIKKHRNLFPAWFLALVKRPDSPPTPIAV